MGGWGRDLGQRPGQVGVLCVVLACWEDTEQKGGCTRGVMSGDRCRMLCWGTRRQREKGIQRGDHDVLVGVGAVLTGWDLVSR